MGLKNRLKKILEGRNDDEEETDKDTFTTGNLLQDANYNVFNDTVDPGLKIQTLLEAEKMRLLNKKKAITPLYETKQRQDAQLRSITQRKNAYTYLVSVAVVAFGVIMALFVIKNYFPVPEWLMNLIIIITIGGSAIYVVILYEDIIKRDRADFEKVDFGLLMDVDEVKDDAITEGKEGAVLGVVDESGVTVKACIGSDCCPDGTTFVNNICKEGFSTMNSTNSSISSFSPMPSFTPV